MIKNWTFGRKLAGGYAVMILVVIAIGVVAVYALTGVTTSKDRVINLNAQLLIEAEQLLVLSERGAVQNRAYALTRADKYLTQYQASREEFAAMLRTLKNSAYTDEGLRLLTDIERASEEHRQNVDYVLNAARNRVNSEQLGRLFDERVAPSRERFDDLVKTFIAREARLLQQAQQAASDAASMAVATVIAMTVAVVLFTIVFGIVLTRSLSRQIATAVGQVQSSSNELQTAATQQASGVKEQANSMNEISTTISELVATSRQIAESAQRVAQIAEQTATAARHGEGTVAKGQDSVSGIRRQVDQVVAHMLDLEKSRRKSVRCSKSSRSWPSKRTFLRSTPPSKRPAPAKAAAASPSSPTKFASSPIA